MQSRNPCPIRCVLLCCYVGLFTLVGIAEANAPTPGGGRPTPSSSTTSPSTLYPEAWSKLLEDGERIVTILAVTAAGIWAYFNFVKGRVYHPRLETQVEGSLSAQGEFSLLIATYALKNVGLAKVPIEQKGSALRVLAATTVNDSAEVTWNRLDTFPVLENHKWIEPSEAIEEQQLVRLPRRGYLAFRLELRVVSRKKEWNAMTIVGCHSSRGVATEETSRSE